MDALQLIETKRVETQKRVTKLRTQLDAAEVELRNLEITAETLARLNLNPVVETAAPRGQSFNLVYNVLGETEDDAKSPKDVHEALLASGVSTISQDNVRTILSRYRDRFTSNDGRYWRKESEPLSNEAGGSDSSEAEQKGDPEW